MEKILLDVYDLGMLMFGWLAFLRCSLDYYRYFMFAR